MGITVSSSRKNLSENLRKIIEWRKSRADPSQEDEPQIPWTASHLSVVLDFVLKLEGDNSNSSHFPARSYTSERHNSKKIAKMVVSFTQDLGKLFKVRKLRQLSDKKKTLSKNELIAAFIAFLLQLLHHPTYLIESFDDGIDILKKELRFLLTLLGDTLLQNDENEQVKNLLAEVETVSNDAGGFVHSFIFTTKSMRIQEALDALFRRISVLKDNIIKFSDLPPFSSNADMTPKTVFVDSHFIVDSLLYDLEDLLNREDNSLIVDAKDQIQKLHEELMLSVSSIKGIEVPRHSEMEELKDAEIRIRGVAYEAEYLINSFLVGDAPLWYLTTRLLGVIHKIRLIGIGLQDIDKDYGIGALKIAEDFSAQTSSQGKNISVVDDIVVGFDATMIDILDQLVGGTQQLQIVLIFGMPGLGKTTLAKKLYSHPTVNSRYDKCYWCVISQVYRRRNLLIDMLMSLTIEFSKDTILKMEEESLVEHIYKCLKGRRYLIIMDDIWDSNAWDDLRRCFPDDGNGSRILFTSRIKDVAPSNSVIYPLPSLSKDQCWELLEKKVFRNKPCPPHLQGIGKEIARNCHGLPLAVVVTAGILSTMDKDESTWEKVRGNLASYDNSMMQILYLSYKNLPSHLKPCFLYFGAFLEDEEIPVRKLMRLWIAEGFIRKDERKRSEIAAEEYLMELIDKSLVIVAKHRSDGGVKACVIHDLLRDFCLRRSEEENFLKSVDNNYSISEKGHHLVSLQNSSTPFCQHARSFHGNYVLDTPFSVLHMKLLRVLDYKRIYWGTALLIGIEFLVNLRYLVINEFPASIGSLVNLEYLRVESYIEEQILIPLVILKMVKLRYLYVTKTGFDQDWNSSQTNSLQSLSWIEVYDLKDEEKLKCSPHLRKLKCYCIPFNVEEKAAYRYPDFSFLTQLESLNMTTFFAGPRLTFADISFPSNIKKLNLSHMGLAWEMVSIIGKLPNLEVLKLGYFSIMGERWDTGDGEFLRLRFLKLAALDLSQWNVGSSEHFPRLQRLVLSDCYCLKEVPREIGEIVTLQFIELQKDCLKSLVQSVIQIEQEQRDNGNEELRVIYTDIRQEW